MGFGVVGGKLLPLPLTLTLSSLQQSRTAARVIIKLELWKLYRTYLKRKVSK